MEKFGRRLSVEANKMNIDESIRIANQHIKRFRRVIVAYTPPHVNYWHDAATDRFIIAYTTNIKWKSWYRVYLLIGRKIVHVFLTIKGVFTWRKN